MFNMNRLSTERRCQIVRCLVEGNSIRATCRITGAAKGTVLKLLRDIGAACAAYHDEHVHTLSCERVQVDEQWCFCYSKQKNVPAEFQGVRGYGDSWTWVALDADSKLVPSWYVSDRDAESCFVFLSDLASRLNDRIQLTSDGYRPYLTEVYSVFGQDVDFAQLEKYFGSAGNDKKPETRYSPGKCNGTKKIPRIGAPARKHISTSYAERLNLTTRMQMRRYTRLTNAFSKKLENLRHAVALHFTHYNYCRVHQTLKTTPAIAFALNDRQWALDDLVGLLDSK